MNKNAYTVAEILISLTIIGVVAAIILPALIGNFNERIWNTQRNALYSRFSQAIPIIPDLRDYGKYILADADKGIEAEDNAAESFIFNALSKVLKINNICDNQHLKDCGIPSSYINLIGSEQNMPTTLKEFNKLFTDSYYDGVKTYQNPQSYINTKSAAFETQNGESVLVLYNPSCEPEMGEKDWHYSQPKMCANFIYDLNGEKGPNTFGKDIGFITALYPINTVVVAPMPFAEDADKSLHTLSSKICLNYGEQSRLPNREELSAMFYNEVLLGITTGLYWSGSIVVPGPAGSAWRQSFHAGDRYPVGRKDVELRNRCIKRALK